MKLLKKIILTCIYHLSILLFLKFPTIIVVLFGKLHTQFIITFFGRLKTHTYLIAYEERQKLIYVNFPSSFLFRRHNSTYHAMNARIVLLSIALLLLRARRMDGASHPSINEKKKLLH